METFFFGLVFILVLTAFVAAPLISLFVCLGIRRRQMEMSGDLLQVREQVRLLLDRKPAVAQPPPPQTAQPQKPPPAPQPTMLTTAVPPAPAAKQIQIPQPPQPLPPRPPYAAPLPPTDEPPAEPGRFEAAARRILARIWNWIIVGEEFRRPGVSTEYAVATNWLVRIGVIIVVVGILFFLDYTSTRGWLGPLGKVAITLLTGSALLLAGIRLLGRRYHLIGQGLLGAGLAVWYAGLFAATNLYGLIGPPTAFALMACVTVGAGCMAVRFDSLLVAILGLIGGYATPLMLASDTVHFPGLFGYMLFLGCGVLGITHRRNWHLLRALALVATYTLAGSALHKAFAPALFWQVMPFLTAFFVLFSTTVFVYQLRMGHPSTLIDLILLVLNAMVYFGFAYQLIDESFAREWCAALTIGLGAFYTAHLYLFLRCQRQDRGLALGFIGLAAFFLILTLPLLLSDQWLTLCWSLQALILLWMARKLDSRFLQYTACALYLIVFARFFSLDLGSSFRGSLPTDLTLLQYGRILLERLISFGVPVATVAAAMHLLRTPVTPARELALQPGNDIEPLVPPSLTVVSAGVVLFAMVFAYLHLELNRTLLFIWDPVRLPMLSMLWVTGALVLLQLYRGIRHQALLALACLFAAGVIIKLFWIDLPDWNLSAQELLYRETYRFVEAAMRLLDFGVILALFLYTFRIFRRETSPTDRQVGTFFGHSSLVLLLLYATLEVNTFLGHFLPGLQAGGLSVFWALFALGLVTGGLLYRVRPLRLTGLAGLAIVVLKIFFADLAQLDPLYKIVAFTLLGIVLLAGAFVYVRFQDRFRETSPEGRIP